MGRKKSDDPDQAGENSTDASSQEIRRFETALSDVEQIVSRLESGQLDLSESLDQYQQGIQTLKECHRLLAGAERRITLLSGFDADGNPVTAPFDQSEMSLDEKQTRRASRRKSAVNDSAPTGSGGHGEEGPGLFS